MMVKDRIHKEQLEMFSILKQQKILDTYRSYKALYERRKEAIERAFTDTKEKHAMRYTPYRGLSQVTNWVRLKSGMVIRPIKR